MTASHIPQPKLRVELVEQRRETGDIMTFVFGLAGQPYSYRAGQYAFFQLDELTQPDARGARRHFTLSSSPSEHDIVQFTTKLRGSGYKETLRTARRGLMVTLEEPRGKFVLPDASDMPLVFLAGGVGVTPFRSMLRYAADENRTTPITLLYAARTPEELVFRRELEHLPQENPQLAVVFTVSDAPEDEAWRGERGRIDAAMLSKFVKDLYRTRFYTSGPPPMVQAMQELLRSLGVPDANVQVERFSGYNSAEMG